MRRGVLITIGQRRMALRGDYVRVSDRSSDHKKLWKRLTKCFGDYAYNFGVGRGCSVSKMTAVFSG